MIDERLRFYAGNMYYLSDVVVNVENWHSGFIVPGDFSTHNDKKKWLPSRGFSAHDIDLFLQYFSDSALYFSALASRQMVMLKHGDVFSSLEYPALAKTRPRNYGGLGVLMKLNPNRHWNSGDFAEVSENDMPFMDKSSAVVWRGVTSGEWPSPGDQPNRERFSARAALMANWGGKSLEWLDVGVTRISEEIKNAFDSHTSEGDINQYRKPALSISDQLKYRYILMPEGKDVASGLKWALRSNSVVIMPTPTVSSWLMEERLIPWRHYVPTKPDFSDLSEKFSYCENNVSLMQEIVRYSSEYMHQFDDENVEAQLNMDVISLLAERTKYVIDPALRRANGFPQRLKNIFVLDEVDSAANVSKSSDNIMANNAPEPSESIAAANRTQPVSSLKITMPAAPKAYLTERLKTANVVLEYGAGGSTIQALEVPSIANVISVETNPNYVDFIKEQSGFDQRLSMLYADVGPVRQWGIPAQPEKYRDKFYNYVTAPWLRADDLSVTPDFILVDGRFRVACFLMSLISACPGTEIMFDDYAFRPHYHVVERYVSRLATYGRAVVFKVPEFTKNSSLIADLLRYSMKSE